MAPTTRQRLFTAKVRTILGVGMNLVHSGLENAKAYKVSPLAGICAAYAGGYAVHVKGDRDAYNLRQGMAMAERYLQSHPELGEFTLGDLLNPRQETYCVLWRPAPETGQPKTLYEGDDGNQARLSFWNRVKDHMAAEDGKAAVLEFTAMDAKSREIIFSGVYDGLGKQAELSDQPAFSP